jgi:hypothetical protein
MSDEKGCKDEAKRFWITSQPIPMQYYADFRHFKKNFVFSFHGKSLKLPLLAELIH